MISTDIFCVVFKFWQERCFPLFNLKQLLPPLFLVRLHRTLEQIRKLVSPPQLLHVSAADPASYGCLHHCSHPSVTPPLSQPPLFFPRTARMASFFSSHSSNLLALLRNSVSFVQGALHAQIWFSLSPEHDDADQLLPLFVGTARMCLA